MSPDGIDNGRRVRVHLSFFTGMAGLREQQEGSGELAFYADLPFGRPAPAGTVDGKPVTVTGVRRSDTAKGMLVVAFISAES
jgi:hypothetical protein